MLGEKVVCATISPHLSILSYIQAQSYLPLWQWHSDFEGFSNGVCHALKITVAGYIILTWHVLESNFEVTVQLLVRFGLSTSKLVHFVL